jgi:hypothetical protein
MRKNPLTMKLELELPEPNGGKDLNKFLDRLVAKMEGKLKSREDTFTLAYVLGRRIRDSLLLARREHKVGGPPRFTVEISYEGAKALGYELKTYPRRPSAGILLQVLSQIDTGLKEKKQHDRDRKRAFKQRDRPTVREARGL